MKRHAVIIVFEAGVTKEEAQRMTDAFVSDLAPIRVDIKNSHTKVETFDDKYGFPVFYVP